MIFGAAIARIAKKIKQLVKNPPPACPRQIYPLQQQQMQQQTTATTITIHHHPQLTLSYSHHHPPPAPVHHRAPATCHPDTHPSAEPGNSHCLGLAKYLVGH
jgi:hypothetical protein